MKNFLPRCGLLVFCALIFIWGSTAHARRWHTVVVTQDIALAAVEQYEDAPQGSVAYVYFRVHNRGNQRVSCEVHAEVVCGPSMHSVPIVLHVAPEDIGGPAAPDAAVPYFAQSVCEPGEKIEAITATLGIEAVAGPPPLDTDVRNGLTPPPPPGYGLPPLTRRVHRSHPGDLHSTGWLVQLDYGLSGLGLPIRNTVINSDGLTGYADTQLAGGLGPRLGLIYWPYLNRNAAVGLGGLVEGGAMGLSNGYTDVTQARVDLAVEAGDRLFLSGIGKASFGYRYAESHSGNPFDLGHEDATIGSGFSRATALLRICTSPQNTLPFCRMGFDIGAVYDMPSYARAAAGGLLLQGSFWLRRTVSIQMEGGWSYPVGGSSIFQATDDGRSGTFAIAVVFNDDFFGVYRRSTTVLQGAP